MKKLFSILLFINLSAVSIFAGAGKVMINNRVDSTDYSYYIRYLGDNSSSIVTDNYSIPEKVNFSSAINLTTYDFVVCANDGNIIHDVSLKVDITPDYFEFNASELTNLRPTAIVSTSFNYTGGNSFIYQSKNQNGYSCEFSNTIEAGYADSEVVLGAFQLNYNPGDFSDERIHAGFYSSTIMVSISDNS
jgi:hypothetical protein